MKSEEIRPITTRRMDGRKTGEEKVDPETVQPLPLDLVVLEIFARLPVKKVFQCLCVSKACGSIIRRSHRFSEAYGVFNPSLVCSLTGTDSVALEYCPLVESPVYAHQDKEFRRLFSAAARDQNSSITAAGRFTVTQMVKGLVCYSCYEGQEEENKIVFVSNVITRETRTLPAPPGLPDGFVTVFSSHYFFGFDPVSGLYKLLRTTVVCPVLGRTVNPDKDHVLVCEILTLGTDSSWRKLTNLGRVPRSLYLGLSYHVICVNGVLYFMDPSSRGEMHSFDLNKEKFGSSTPVPSFEPEREVKYGCLVQYGGRPSVFLWLTNVAVLCTMEDDDEGTWISREVGWNCDNDTFLPVGNLPTGELLLANQMNLPLFHNRQILLATQTAGDAFTWVFTYNHKKEKLQRSFFVPTLPWDGDQMRAIATKISCLEPNFKSLEAILGIDPA